MPITDVGSLGSGVTTTTGSAHTFSPASNQITLGNTVVLFFNLGGYDTAATNPVTDNAGNTWTLLSHFRDATAGTGVGIAICKPTTALTTATVITATATSSGYAVGWHLHEFSNLSSTSEGSITAAGTPNPSVLATTTLYPRDLVLAAWSVFTATPTFTPTSGWTGANTHGHFTGTTYYELFWQFIITSSAGAISTSGAVANSTGSANSSTLTTVLQSEGTMLRPISDITVGDWTPTPSSPTTLFDKLSEIPPRDTDYITGTTTTEIKFG